MYDLVLTGGTVSTPAGPAALDIGIRGEKIAVVAMGGTLAASGSEVHDVSGLLVVPGGIDPHIHTSWPVMQERAGEPVLSASAQVVSRAAIFGGTTTLIDFAVAAQGESLAEAIDRTELSWRDSYTDFSHHIMVQGTTVRALLPQLGASIRAGYPSVKVFTTDITPNRSGRKVSHGWISEIMEVVAANNGLLAVHAEDDELVMHAYSRLSDAGISDVSELTHVHSALSEELSFERIVRLARHHGARVYFMHVSAAAGVAAVAAAQRRGEPVTAETLHAYLLHTDAAYDQEQGHMYHTYPSLKGEEDVAALWSGIMDGTIACVSTDELCTDLDIKLAGQALDEVTGGHVGVEPRMALLYTEVVQKRGLGLERFVELTSSGAAKALGLYPQKGAIAAGSDADLAVLDTGVERTLHASDMHEADYSSWEGMPVYGWPTSTYLRGRRVMTNGEILDHTGFGQRVLRSLD